MSPQESAERIAFPLIGEGLGGYEEEGVAVAVQVEKIVGFQHPVKALPGQVFRPRMRAYRHPVPIVLEFNGRFMEGFGFPVDGSRQNKPENDGKQYNRKENAYQQPIGNNGRAVTP